MSKIGDFVIDQEDRGFAVYNERDRSYDFTNRNPISLQKISSKGGESAGKRVLYRQAIRRSRIGRARILQKRPEA